MRRTWGDNMKAPDRIELLNTGTMYYLGNELVTEEEYRERYPVPKGKGVFMTSSKTGWPYTSTSVGCHPRQRKKFMNRMRELGVPTEFNHEGRAVFTSREHQRKYCQATGNVNFDENWSGRGPVTPPPEKKIRPKMQIRDRLSNGFTKQELAEAAKEIKKPKRKRS